MIAAADLAKHAIFAATPHAAVIQLTNDGLHILEDTPENAAEIATLKALLAACRPQSAPPALPRYANGVSSVPYNDPQDTINTLLDKLSAIHKENHFLLLIVEIEQHLTALADTPENLPLRTAYTALLAACHARDEHAEKRACNVLRDDFNLLFHWRDLFIADIQAGAEWATVENIARDFDADFAHEIFSEAGVTIHECSRST